MEPSQLSLGLNNSGEKPNNKKLLLNISLVLLSLVNLPLSYPQSQFSGHPEGAAVCFRERAWALEKFRGSCHSQPCSFVTLHLGGRIGCFSFIRQLQACRVVSLETSDIDLFRTSRNYKATRYIRLRPNHDSLISN